MDAYIFIGGCCSTATTVISQSHIVVVARGQSRQGDLVLGVGASEGVLVEAGLSSHGPVNAVTVGVSGGLEGSGGSLEGLEVDEVAGSLLISQGHSI